MHNGAKNHIDVTFKDIFDAEFKGQKRQNFKTILERLVKHTTKALHLTAKGLCCMRTNCALDFVSRLVRVTQCGTEYYVGFFKLLGREKRRCFFILVTPMGLTT